MRCRSVGGLGGLGGPGGCRRRDCLGMQIQARRVHRRQDRPGARHFFVRTVRHDEETVGSGNTAIVELGVFIREFHGSIDNHAMSRWHIHLCARQLAHASEGRLLQTRLLESFRLGAEKFARRSRTPNLGRSATASGRPAKMSGTWPVKICQTTLDHPCSGPMLDDTHRAGWMTSRVLKTQSMRTESTRCRKCTCIWQARATYGP